MKTIERFARITAQETVQPATLMEIAHRRYQVLMGIHRPKEANFQEQENSHNLAALRLDLSPQHL